MYTIQQVAQHTGLTEYTLRYYEQIGLIDPVPRATNGHRRYTDDDLNRIKFLNKLRATGMPIKQMVAYVQAPTDERLEILEAHYQQVQAQMEELQVVAGMIEWKMSLYKSHLQDEKEEVSGRNYAKENYR